DPFRALREPDRRRRDEERPSRSEQRTGNKPKTPLDTKSPIQVRIKGQPCPMLVEGLYTAHAWWKNWGGPSAMPSIEASSRVVRRGFTGDRRGVAFLSGGVDSLHMLMRNHRLYRREDPAYIRDALFI